MNISVVTHNTVEGFHCWPGAPERCGFLADRHRHVFVIVCEFPVSDADREIEIFTRQQEIQRLAAERFGTPAEFGAMSCEHIALWLMEEFPGCEKCTVLEDGAGGAIVRR